MLDGSDAQRNQELGTIRVECFHAMKVPKPTKNQRSSTIIPHIYEFAHSTAGTDGRNSQKPGSKESQVPTMHTDPVHERTKKAGAHVTE